MKPILKYLLLIFIISFVLYFPSIFGFYTNDDFFLLKISQTNSLGGFINFFNLTVGPDGLGMYRPITTQVFYFLGRSLFNLNPIGLHVISFLVFFGVIYLVFRLALELLKNERISLVAALLYATSATHFGHLYYLATFQELGLTTFFLLSVIYFVKFLDRAKLKYYLVSFVFFLASLLSKETAVVLPAVLVVIYALRKVTKDTKVSISRFFVFLLPHLLILAGYLYLRVRFYGLAVGDSYVWDFSLRAFNTLFWYGLWSLNIPEMLVDFVGPGFVFNPNLFKFYSKEIIPIFVLFATLVAGIGYLLVKNQKKLINQRAIILILFSVCWFVITLIPVLFLPLHKFTFYLTLPLIGIVFVISYLINLNDKRPITIVFLAIWVAVSVLTLTLTYKTNWITKGAETARRVHDYLLGNAKTLADYKTIVFYDVEEDDNLPWSPAEVLKVTLSDQNYFKVFWNDKFTVSYYTSGNDIKENGAIRIRSRKFLGY